MNPYETLKILRTATRKEIKAAYIKLSLEHHPDRRTDKDSKKFTKIAEAYRILSNPTSKKLFDQSESSIKHKDLERRYTRGINLHYNARYFSRNDFKYAFYKVDPWEAAKNKIFCENLINYRKEQLKKSRYNSIILFSGFLMLIFYKLYQ